MMVDPIEYAWRALHTVPMPQSLGPAPNYVKPPTPAEQLAQRGRKQAPPPVADGVRFYDGDPCARGHTVRYVNTGHCVECTRAYSRKPRPGVQHARAAHQPIASSGAGATG